LNCNFFCLDNPVNKKIDFSRGRSTI